MVPEQRGDNYSKSDAELIEIYKANFVGVSQRVDAWDSRALNLLSTSFVEGYKRLGVRFENITPRTQGRPLIDLGGGSYGAPQWILNKLKPSVYVDVDLDAFGKDTDAKKFSKTDALEYLLTVPDSSSNVLSTAFLCKDWLGDSSDDYIGRIMQNIARVLPENGFFLTSYFDFPKLADENGLTLNPQLSVLNQNNSRNGGQLVYVYEKTIPQITAL